MRDSASNVFGFTALGCPWSISIWDDLENKLVLEYESSLKSMAQDFEAKYSRFLDDSYLSSLNSQIGEFETPKLFTEMLRLYFELNEKTEDKFTPLIGATLSDLGYDMHYSLRAKKQVRSTPQLKSALEILSDTRIKIKKPIQFDLGGLGKGFLVDLMGDFLKGKGVKHFLVNGSGDICFFGHDSALKVGLEDPNDPKKVIGSVDMNSGAMASSALNRRAWDAYTHIVNPLSVHHDKRPSPVIAAWVMAKKTWLADALATCLFLCEAEPLQKHFDFEYLILRKDYRVKRSEGFKAQLY